VVFPPRDQAAEPLQPREQPLDLPTSAITAERTTVLRRMLATAEMGRDHFNVVSLQQMSIQRVAIIGFVAYQPRRQLIEKTLPQDFLYQLAFVW